MEYLFDFLIDPTSIEIDISENNKKYKPFPDSYRKYLFDKKMDVFNIDTSLIHLGTNIKKKYWSYDNEKIIKKIINIVTLYINLPKHYLTKYLLNKINLDENILKYYNKLYDIADIIIIRSRNDRQLFFKTINALLKIATPFNHIVYRIIIYISVYFIKLFPHTEDSYTTTIINKLNEFKNTPVVWKYFTKSELKRYIKLTTKFTTNNK